MSQTVLAFQENTILAARGLPGKSPVLSEVQQLRLQGQGDAFDRWQRTLTACGEEWKRDPVCLVLPANLCATRVLSLPYGRGKQLAEMAARELEDSFRNETADYSVLRRDKKTGVDICAGGAEAASLERILKICQEAGFVVGKITVPLEGYLHVLRQLPEYGERTAIYLFFEEESMLSVLCQEGRYVYSSRSRLFSERGTYDFGTEIVRSVSGILQFSGNKEHLNITEVRYAGCGKDDFEVGMDGILGLHLQVFPMMEELNAVMPAGESALDWIPCIGALTCPGRKEKQIDLSRAVRHPGWKGDRTAGLIRHVFPFAAVLLCCLAVSAAVAGLNLHTDRRIRALQAEMEDETLQKKYREFLDLQAEQHRFDAGIAETGQTISALSTYPEFSSSVLHRIQSAGGSGITLFITRCDMETGILVFDASSREVLDIPSYILKLQKTGLFYTVDYTGYVYENGWYTLSLSCTMEGKTPSGGEDAVNVQEVAENTVEEGGAE